MTEAGYDRGALQLVRNLSGGITDMSGGINGVSISAIAPALINTSGPVMNDRP